MLFWFAVEGACWGGGAGEWGGVNLGRINREMDNLKEQRETKT